MQGESKTVSTEKKQAGIKSQNTYTPDIIRMSKQQNRKDIIERRNCTIKKRFGIEIRDNI